MASGLSSSLEQIFSDTQAEPEARKANLVAWVAQLRAQIESLETKLSVAEVAITNYTSAGDAKKNRRKKRKEAQKKKKREALAREAEEANKVQIVIEECSGGILGIAYGKWGPEEEKAERYYRSAI